MTSPAHETLPALLAEKCLLIFDLDGTLADTSPLHAAAFQEVLTAEGVPLHYPDIAGMPTRDALRACFAASGMPLGEGRLNELVTAKQRAVRRAIRSELRSTAGADAFLRWARGRFRLALYSSGSRGTVQMSLDSLGLAEEFEVVLCGDEVDRGKPHPDGFLHILERTGVPAAGSLVFEDSVSGIESAARAGCEVIQILSDDAPAHPEAVIGTTWTDLLTILDPRGTEPDASQN